MKLTPGLKLSLSLFFQFFSISASTLGGGYVMVAVMQQQFVEKKKLLSLERFTDALAKAQMLPGPVAVTSSIFLGYEISSFEGAFLSCLGVVLPPFFSIYIVYQIIEILNSQYLQYFMFGVKCATIAAIFQFLLKIILKKRESVIYYIILAILTVIAIYFKISPILLLLAGTSILFLIGRIFPSSKLEKQK